MRPYLLAAIPSFVTAGLVPAIHVFGLARNSRRGCPRQARAWRGRSSHLGY